MTEINLEKYVDSHVPDSYKEHAEWTRQNVNSGRAKLFMRMSQSAAKDVIILHLITLLFKVYKARTRESWQSGPTEQEVIDEVYNTLMNILDGEPIRGTILGVDFDK